MITYRLSIFFCFFLSSMALAQIPSDTHSPQESVEVNHDIDLTAVFTKIPELENFYQNLSSEDKQECGIFIQQLNTILNNALAEIKVAGEEHTSLLEKLKQFLHTEQCVLSIGIVPQTLTDQSE